MTKYKRMSPLDKVNTKKIIRKHIVPKAELKKNTAIEDDVKGMVHMKGVAVYIAEKYDYPMSIREIAFIGHYCGPTSEGYRNVGHAGFLAGMTEEQALETANQKWFKEMVQIINDLFLSLAEKRIFEIMNMDPREKITITKKTKKGKVTTEVSERINPGLLRVISDLAKFAAERKGGASWQNKLTLEHETGPKTIGELIKHLSGPPIPKKLPDNNIPDGNSTGERGPAAEEELET